MRELKVEADQLRRKRASKITWTNKIDWKSHTENFRGGSLRKKQNERRKDLVSSRVLNFRGIRKRGVA